LYVSLPDGHLTLGEGEKQLPLYTIVEDFKDFIKRWAGKRYFVTNVAYRITGVIIDCTIFFGLYGLFARLFDLTHEESLHLNRLMWIIVLPTFIGICLVFRYLLPAPTLLGRKAMDQIEGFKMYLSAVEGDPLNRMNPPENTPELFEKYLPYALALDLEQKWAEQFTEVLKKASIGGAVYSPGWYRGALDVSLNLPDFTSSLATSFTHTISSSVHAANAAAMGVDAKIALKVIVLIAGFAGGGRGGGGRGGW
jgi:uncharacterized membrane protein